MQTKIVYGVFAYRDCNRQCKELIPPLYELEKWANEKRQRLQDATNALKEYYVVQKLEVQSNDMPV